MHESRWKLFLLRIREILYTVLFIIIIINIIIF